MYGEKTISNIYVAFTRSDYSFIRYNCNRESITDCQCAIGTTDELLIVVTNTQPLPMIKLLLLQTQLQKNCF